MTSNVDGGGFPSLDPATGAVLDRAWDSIDTGAAPVGDLLQKAHRSHATQQRVWAIAGAAAACVLIAGTAASVSWLHRPTQDRADQTPATSASNTLEVTVAESLPDPVSASNGGALVETLRGQAYWDGRTQTLFYVTRTEFQAGCPPTATAREMDSVVDVQLTAPAEGCYSFELPVTLVIRGLRSAPADLRIEGTGEPLSAIVRPVLDVDDVMSLDCEDPSQYAQAVIDDFRLNSQDRTPQAAVNAWLNTGETAYVATLNENGQGTRVAIIRPDGSTRAIINVASPGKGWLAQSIRACGDEAFGPFDLD